SSKEACYLCDSFIKAHGSFYVSKAHRQIFRQWTVPDLSAYNDATLQRFRTALSAVNRAVLKDLRDARHHRLFRQYPLQSSINLHKIVLPTPSLTTILSNTGTELGSVSTISCKPPEILGQLDGARSSSPTSETGLESGRAAIKSEATLPYSESSGLSTICVMPSSPQHVRLNSLNLHFCLDEQASTITTIYSSRAIVSLKTFKTQNDAKEDTECQWFDVEDIPPGGEIILTAPVSKEGNLEFILAARSGNSIRPTDETRVWDTLNDTSKEAIFDELDLFLKISYGKRPAIATYAGLDETYTILKAFGMDIPSTDGIISACLTKAKPGLGNDIVEYPAAFLAIAQAIGNRQLYLDSFSHVIGSMVFHNMTWGAITKHYPELAAMEPIATKYSSAPKGRVEALIALMRKFIWPSIVQTFTAESKRGLFAEMRDPSSNMIRPELTMAELIGAMKAYKSYMSNELGRNGRGGGYTTLS
ncbi:hypothetical protein MMC26_007290, partial [Xylographa opegraphella]|nr:hypothetical protein [Xylographa opegraphella]